MVDRLQALKKAGKPMPKTIDEVEQQLGTWQDFKQSGGGAEAFDVVAPPGMPLFLLSEDKNRFHVYYQLAVWACSEADLRVLCVVIREHSCGS